LPGASAIGVIHTPPGADQVTVAPVAAPDPSINASGVPWAGPAALFQLLCGTTPALSPAAMAAGLVPTKSMPIGPATAEGASTTRAAVVSWLTEPEVPVIVRVEFPAGVPDEVVTVRVALPDPVTDAGLNPIVVPAGAPVTPNDTVPAKPFSAAVVTV
jgi:hypothetical protein